MINIKYLLVGELLYFIGFLMFLLAIPNDMGVISYLIFGVTFSAYAVGYIEGYVYNMY